MTALSGWALAVAGLMVGLVGAAAAEPAGKAGVKVRKWASGLGGPQGIVRGGRGEILVAEHDTGRVSRFSADGKPLGVLATGLQSPSWALFHDHHMYVAERKGNSVARIAADGGLTRLPGEVIDPLGLALDPTRPGSLLVVSHRSSLVHRFAWDAARKSHTLEAAAVVTPTGGAKYGWRDLAVGPDGAYYFTDEVGGVVLRRKPGGAIEPWASNLASPSGLAFSSKGDIFVTEEANGRVSRLSASGTPTVLAEGLGAARAILFLNDRTILVTDRKGGDVWEVTLP